MVSAHSQSSAREAEVTFLACCSVSEVSSRYQQSHQVSRLACFKDSFEQRQGVVASKPTCRQPYQVTCCVAEVVVLAKAGNHTSTMLTHQHPHLLPGFRIVKNIFLGLEDIPKV